MIEVWKDIKGYEGLYQVSNLGNVKSLKYNKERILRPGYDKYYLFVVLRKDGKYKNYTIHRLVAEAFIPNPFKLPCVNHKDENKLNNCVENLEWCTQKYNVEYSCAKLIYCVELAKVFQSSHDAERLTGIHQSNITQCLKGTRKSAGGYHWKYTD